MLWSAVLVLAIGTGAFAFVATGDQRAESKAQREYEAYRQAAAELQPVLAGYALPVSVTPTDCDLGFRCGTSELEPAAAANAVAASLVPLGLERQESGCEPGRAPTNAHCTAVVAFRGHRIVTVNTARSDVPFRNFGTPTSVTVRVDDPSGDGVLVLPEPVPVTAADLQAVVLGRSHRAALRCEQPATAGCTTYLGRTVRAGGQDLESRNRAWRATGRALVRAGWQQVGGRCETADPAFECTVTAHWPRPDRHRVRVSFGFESRGADLVTLVGLRAEHRVPG